MPGARRERERLEAELESARPFLALAREISEDVARLAGDEGASSAAIEEAIRSIPERERWDVVRAVFARLPPDEQWAVLERTFPENEELRAALADERDARVAEVRRTGARRRLARTAQAEHRLDTAAVPVHDLLTLGLFREADVAGAAGLGARSTACARRLVLRRLEAPATFAVVEDVFNPGGGYFVTGEYDGDAWRRERLASHAAVRVGSLAATPEGRRFEPVLHVGGRVDVEHDGRAREGRLHLGYAIVGDEDVFAGGGRR